jgi:hypothetical protein
MGGRSGGGGGSGRADEGKLGVRKHRGEEKKDRTGIKAFCCIMRFGGKKKVGRKHIFVD